MKRKLLIAGAAVLALFIGLILIVGMLKSSQDATRGYYEVSATPDGRLAVEPTARNTFVVMSKDNVTNLPAKK